LPAVALSADTSVLSCIGNDFGFKDVFARQVEALVKKGDILWAFSMSGSSENIVSAAEAAKKKSASVVAFTGRPNSPLEKLADTCLAVDAPSAGAAQEIGQLAYHIICELVDEQMF
jgi:D-sedoheptulose 7-phosphate isomerase